MACDDDAASTPDAEVLEVSTDVALESTDAEVAEAEETVVPGRELGLNDLTFLMPLVAQQTPLVPAEELIDEAVFASLVTEPGDVFTEFSQLRVVAVRFDVCDRHVPGECPLDADGSLRIVLQPMQIASEAPGFAFDDIAVHAFFPIPHADMPAVIGRLRAMAELADIDLTTPLQPSPALTAAPEGPYRDALAQLIRDYAAPDQLIRLTSFAQFSIRAALNWMFRGVERASLDVPLARIDIPDLASQQQEVLLIGRTSYEITPLAELPLGIGLVVDENAFAAATPERQRKAREALAEIDNPMKHTPDTMQCAACHITTQLAHHRGPMTDVAGVYQSPLDPKPFGVPDAHDRTLRALGYVGFSPVVSQRAANETAQVAKEIEVRYPSGR